MKKFLAILVLGFVLHGCATPVGQEHSIEIKNKYVAMTNMYPKSAWKTFFTGYTFGIWTPHLFDFYGYSNESAEDAALKSERECNDFLKEKNWENKATCTFSFKRLTALGEEKKTNDMAKERAELKIAKKKVELLTMIKEAKSTCKELGFKENTDKFSDCALKLYTQKIDQTTKQKETVIVQTQASSGSMTIYDPVRDNQRMIDQGMKMLSGRCTLGIDC